jgi:dephospho-CoA kinase
LDQFAVGRATDTTVPYMEPTPLTIGLTGGIACGKTAVSQLFAQLGIAIIDTDVIARQLVEPDQPTFTAIIQAFGNHLLQADGQLNRSRLRQQIFSDPKQRQQLENILHPPIFERMWAQVKTVTSAYCVLVIPLLLETQQVNQVHRVLVVDCSVTQQRQRLKQRNGFDPDTISQILASQAQRDARLAIAHDVIYNDSDYHQLQSQVLGLHQHYVQLAQYHLSY